MEVSEKQNFGLGGKKNYGFIWLIILIGEITQSRRRKTRLFQKRFVEFSEFFNLFLPVQSHDYT